MDSSKPDNSGLYIQQMKEDGFIHVPQLASSPDPALCDRF
jgi:hypothetical protein